MRKHIHRHTYPSAFSLSTGQSSIFLRTLHIVLSLSFFLCGVCGLFFSLFFSFSFCKAYCEASQLCEKEEMVKYPRNNQYKQMKRSKECIVCEDDDSCSYIPFGFVCENSVYGNRRAKLKLLYFIFLSLIYCCLILAPQFLSSNSAFSLFYSSETDVNGCLCSSVPNGTICCDRTSIRSDICIMKGNVRTHSVSSSVILYRTNSITSYFLGSTDDGDDDEEVVIRQEKIRPYTRKWETGLMNTVNELDLIVKKDLNIHHRCDIQHNVPAVFFSTGGYTGNLYHEFNDGILPLFITSQHLNKKVVFVILEYHDWWMTKYGDILSQLSDFPAIDFNGDKRVHCFPEAIVGLRIHDELTVDASLMADNKTVLDFRTLLDRAYWPRIRDLILDEEREAVAAMPPSFKDPIEEKKQVTYKPKLVIVSRNGSRAINNEDSLVKLAEHIGFFVEVLRPQRTTELSKIYRVLNSSDVMIGVHGAAMTHFLFMKPGSIFIQVIPLGTDWAADTYYGQPSVKLGVRYIGYKILPKESSLYHDYDKRDPILTDPNSVNDKGWEFTKKIYLDGQTVNLDLRRFQKRLLRAYYYTIARKNQSHKHSLSS